MIDSSTQSVMYGLEKMTVKDLHNLRKADLLKLASEVLEVQQQDRKENQLLYYIPASERAKSVHSSKAIVTGIFGGNGSSKSETGIVELLIHATGVVPYSLRDIGIDWQSKLRGPVQCRVQVESITSTLAQAILPKFKWQHWTGIDEPGGDRGHWGWVPRSCLIDGEWAKSWSEKTRILRVLYKDPNHYDRVLGESTIQFCSHDQESTKMASGDIHFYLFDEPPPLAHWREGQVRTARVKGRVLLCMTWPDDPAINVDWLFDEVWEPGQPGPNKSPNIDIYRLISTENRTIDQAGLLQSYSGWNDLTRSVRVEGKPIRFSNRVHADFTESEEYWCFGCGRKSEKTPEGRCARCDRRDGVDFCHVQEFEHNPNWPVVWVVDPHPRKPHMSAYIAVGPDDRAWQVAELECAGDPADLAKQCRDMEEMFRFQVRCRLIDPKMAANPSGVVRERTWLDEFYDSGLHVDPADSSDVGRGIFDQLLKPDQQMKVPFVTIHPRCQNTILQLKRYMWDDWKLSSDKDQKQVAKRKYDDYPAIWRYFCNGHFTFQYLARGSKMIQSAGTYRR